MSKHIETYLRILPQELDSNIEVKDYICRDDDGELTQSKGHYYVIRPGDDVSDKPDRVKQAVAAFHTAEVIAAFKAKQAAVQAAELAAFQARQAAALDPS